MKPWLVTFETVWNRETKSPRNLMNSIMKPMMRRAKKPWNLWNASLQSFVHKTLNDEPMKFIESHAMGECFGGANDHETIYLKPFSLKPMKPKHRGNLSNISINHTCYRPETDQNPPMKPLAWPWNLNETCDWWFWTDLSIPRNLWNHETMRCVAETWQIF